MLLTEVIGKLGFEQKTGGASDGVEVTGGYCGDLLSDVIGNAKAGSIWVTIQTHQNVIAVGTLLGLSAIVVAGGPELDDKTLQKADEEDVRILTTRMKAFEAAGKLYELGIR